MSCHEQVRLTYDEAKTRADKLAVAFHRIGLDRGDRIAIWAPNISVYYVTMLAAARAGLVLVPLNPAYQVRELEYCLRKVSVKAIVAPESHKSQRYYEMLAKIMPEMEQAAPGKIQSAALPMLSTVIMAAEQSFK